MHDHVTAEDLERRLDWVRARAAGPEAGVFGPDSLLWRVDRESAVFLGAGRALLLQLAHPWVAAAICEHSRSLADPIGRFHRTFGIVFTLVFGTLDQAFAAARRLHERHEAIRGVLPGAAGRFAAGSTYRANEVSALRWVHATLVDTALRARDLVLPPLTPDERERYYAETHVLAALFGIPPESLPPDWRAFAAYCERAESELLDVGPTARDIAAQLFAGAGTWLKSPAWYRALTAELLSQRLRTGFDLAYGAGERRAAARARAWLRRVYPALPAKLRTVGPYQEATARVADREPDRLTRFVNRLWIGRPSMAERGPRGGPP